MTRFVLSSCAFGDLCVYKDGTREVWADNGPVCASDARRVAAALDELPQLYIGLTRLYTEPRSASDGPRGTQVHPGLPVRPEVDALMRETSWVLASWEEVVRDIARLTVVTANGSLMSYVVYACQTIRRHLDTFLRLPETSVIRHVDASQVAALGDGVDGTVMGNGDAIITRDLTGPAGALELLDLQRRARGMLGETRRVRRIDVVTCPRCDLLSLTRPEGSEYIECSDQDCGTLLTSGEYSERVTGALSKARAELAGLETEEAA